MRSTYVWAMGIGLVVALAAGCKQNDEPKVTMAPSQEPAREPYPEPPVNTLAPAPEAGTADHYQAPPVDTTPIPGEDVPAARSGSRTTTPRSSASSNRSRSAAPRSNYAPSSPRSGKTYLVQKGDTLQKISQKFYGTTRQWRKIYDANRAKIKGGPDKLAVGTKLTIPAK